MISSISFPGSAWECIPGGSATSFYAQVAEPSSMHSQAFPGRAGRAWERDW